MFKKFRHLRIKRPLAILDAETTGVDPATDRIVELAILRAEPGKKSTLFHNRLNPQRPIPQEATAIHGITDKDVANSPTFGDVARKVQRLLDPCSLVGFNIKRFDLPCLMAEFSRAGASFRVNGRAVIDAQEIFFDREPRDLSAAVRQYLGKPHESAHSAIGDVLATAAILDAQLGRYRDLPRNVDALDSQFRSVDLARRFAKENGRIVFTFGKHRGRALREVARTDPDYLKWMLAQDFLDDVKALIRRSLNGQR